jgi:predicted phage-related endonuclease
MSNNFSEKNKNKKEVETKIKNYKKIENINLVSLLEIMYKNIRD